MLVVTVVVAVVLVEVLLGNGVVVLTGVVGTGTSVSHQLTTPENILKQYIETVLNDKTR